MKFFYFLAPIVVSLASASAQGAPPTIESAGVGPNEDSSKPVKNLELVVDGDNLEVVNEVYFGKRRLPVIRILKDISVEGMDRFYAEVPLNTPPAKVTIVTPGGRVTTKEVVDVPTVCLATSLKVTAEKGALIAAVTFRNTTKKPCEYSEFPFHTGGPFSQGFRITTNDDADIFSGLSYVGDRVSVDPSGSVNKFLAPGATFTVKENLSKIFELPAKGTSIKIVHSFQDSWTIRSNVVAVKVP